MSLYDTVVIGAGLAGLTAACQLAQANKNVLLVSTGVGSLVLASGCVDVLGFQPPSSQEPVKKPLDKLTDFISEHANHPYKVVGKDTVQAGLKSFAQLVGDYQGQGDQNWLLPSTAGAVHPTCLAPRSLANGELSTGGKMLIIGFRELRDFYPSLISQNLNEQKLGVEATALVISAPPPITGKVNTTPIELARAFEKADFRQAVVDIIKGQSDGYDRIGFPAVLGLKQHDDVLADLEKQLGQTVFEISTLPPSVPGRRLFEKLRQTLLAAGGRIIIGSKVVDGKIENGKVTQIRFQTANRLRTIKAKNYVLATGGVFGGGLQTDSEGKVWEPIFGLPVEASTNRHEWFDAKFIAPTGQPVASYGIKVNPQLNPVNGSKPIVSNLYIVGSLIAHADWTQGRTGDGVALATAKRASELAK